MNNHLTPATTPPDVSLRYETATCAAPGRTGPVRRQGTGRPARFCSPACRVRDHRTRQALKDTPITVEVDYGSASSRGRRAGAAWMVRLRRSYKAVIVAIGRSRAAADRLAEQLVDLVETPEPGDP